MLFGHGKGGEFGKRRDQFGFLGDGNRFADGRDDDWAIACRAMKRLAHGGTAGEEIFAAVGAFKEDVADGNGEIVGAVGAGENGAHVVFIGAEMGTTMLADEKDVVHVVPEMNLA